MMYGISNTTLSFKVIYVTDLSLTLPQTPDLVVV